MAKDKKLFSKIVLVILTLLIVLGFTVPGFINETDNGQYVEPRICKTDADCYLMCDEAPVKVLCSQNLCMQNACDEHQLYPFVDEVVEFSLVVKVNAVNKDLSLLSNTQDLFVKFSEGKVQMFSSGISLGQVLSKVKTKVDAECLTVNSENYCNSGEKEVKLMVNGERSYSYSDYVPEVGDEIEVVYS